MATIEDEFDNPDDFKMDDLEDSDELNKSIKALAEAILKYNTMVNVAISRTSANKMDDGTPDVSPNVSPNVSPDGTPRSDNTLELERLIRNEMNYYSDINSGSDNESTGYESDESKIDYNNAIKDFRILSSRRGAFMIHNKKDSVNPGVSFIENQNNSVSRFPDMNTAIISSIPVNTSDQSGSQNTQSDIPNAEIVLKEGPNEIKINQDNTGNIASVAIVDSDGTSNSVESMEEALANITPVIYPTIENVVDALNENPTVPSISTPHGEMLDASIDILSTLARTPEIGTSVDVRDKPYESLIDISIDILSENPTPKILSVDEQIEQSNIIKAIDTLSLPDSKDTNIIKLASGNKTVIADIGSQDPNNPIPAVVIPDITAIEPEIKKVDDVNTAITELKEDPSLDITLTVSPITKENTEVDNPATITITPDGNTTVDTPNSDETTYNDITAALIENPEIARTPELGTMGGPSIGVRDLSEDELSSQDKEALANSPKELSEMTEAVASGEENINTPSDTEIGSTSSETALNNNQESQDASSQDNEVEIVEPTKPPAPVVDLVPTEKEQAEINRSNDSIDSNLKKEIDKIKDIMRSNVYISEKTFKDIIQEYGGLGLEDTVIDNYIENKMDKYKYDNDGKYIKAQHEFGYILSMLNTIKTQNSGNTSVADEVGKIIKYYNENITPNDTIDNGKIEELLKLVKTLPADIKTENGTSKSISNDDIIKKVQRIKDERKYINIKLFIGDLTGGNNTENAKYDIIETIGKYSRGAGDTTEIIDHTNQNAIQEYIEKSITKNITEISYISNNFDVLQKIFRQIKPTKKETDIYKINEFSESDIKVYESSGQNIKLPDIFISLEKLQSAHEPKEILECLHLILKIDPKELMKIYEKIYTHVINLMSVILYLFTIDSTDIKLGETIGRSDNETERFIKIKSLDKVLIKNSSFNSAKEKSIYITPNMIVYDYFTTNSAKISNDVNIFNAEYKSLKSLLNVCLIIIEYVLKGSTVKQNSTVEHPPTSIIGRMLEQSEAYKRSGVSEADKKIVNTFLLDINRHKTYITKNIDNLDHLHTYGNDLYNGIIAYNKIYSKDKVFQSDKEKKLLQYIKPEPVPKNIDAKLKDIPIDVTGTDLQTQQQLNLVSAPTGKNKTLAPLVPPINKQKTNVQSPRDNMANKTRKLPPISPPSNRLLGKTKKNLGSLNTKQILTENTWEQGNE